MEPALLSALAALSGSLVGAAASVLTSWLTQRGQYFSQMRAADRTKREALYSEFIDEASRLYADALHAERPEVGKMVHLLALVNRIHLHADLATVKAAEDAVEKLVTTYFAPPVELEQLINREHAELFNPLHEFSETCRGELRRVG